MLQAFLVVSSIAMAGTAAFIYRTSFDEGVRSGNEVLIALPTALDRAFPGADTLSLAELEQWRTDPVLVDRVGLHPTSRQLVDSCGGKEQIWHEHVSSGSLDALSDTFFSEPPYLHFSGLSYVSLAAGTDPTRFARPEFLIRHRAFIHVAELLDLEPYGLPLSEPETRLTRLNDHQRHRLAVGSELLVSAKDVFVGIQLEAGPGRYRVYSRSDLNRLLASRGLAVARPGMDCVQTREGLCLASDPGLLERKVARAQAFGGGSLGLLLMAALGQARRRSRDRRQGERERLLMLQTLSHELRTPATSLALSVEPIRSSFDSLPDALQPAFLRICDNVQRLQRMVEASSHYLRGEAGCISPVTVPDVAALLDDLATGHQVSFCIALEAMPARIDSYWLGICVRNLIQNARQHGASPVEFEAHADRDTLVITITDGGVGLSMPFARAKALFSHRDESPGLGLGLSITARIARAMGGSLSHAPSPTRFILRLPGALPSSS
ncbi:MAG: HAMP domain-containing sensor histidine kinase [Myxococcota bacterium]